MKYAKFLTYPNLFLLIGLFFGFKLVFLNPPWQTNDADRHFYNMYNIAQGHLGPQIKNNKRGYILPKKLFASVQAFTNISFSDTLKIRADIFDDAVEENLDKENTDFYEVASTDLLPLAYLPSAITLKIGSYIHDSPVWLLWWGRIGSLLVYLSICFYALKIIPRYKALLFLVALCPMSIYQGASISYDSMSFALLYLYFAYTLLLYFKDGPITLKDVLIIFAIAFTHRFAKGGYYLLYFSMAFIPLAKFEAKKVYFTMIALLAVAAFLPGIIWNSYLNLLHLPPAKPLMNDYLYDGTAHLKYIISNPFKATQVVLANIYTLSDSWIQGSIARFGYAYKMMPWFFPLAYIVMMLFSVLVESKFDIRMNKAFRLGMLGLSVATVCAIVLAFYITASPVGGKSIHGIQGRYFTPMLPFIMLGTFYIQNDWFKKYEKWLMPIFVTAAVAMLLYTVNFIEFEYYY